MLNEEQNEGREDDLLTTKHDHPEAAANPRSLCLWLTESRSPSHGLAVDLPASSAGPIKDGSLCLCSMRGLCWFLSCCLCG